MITFISRLLLVFSFLLASPTYALQINTSTSHAFIKEGETVTLRAEFIEENIDAGCSIGFRLSSNGASAIFGRDFTISAGEFGEHFLVNRRELSILFNATGVSGTHHSLSVSLLVKDKEGVDPNEIISALVSEVSTSKTCTISKAYRFPTVAIIDTDKVIIDVTSSKGTTSSDIKNGICETLRVKTNTANIQNRKKQDSKSIERLTGKNKSFYKSDCIQRNDNSRHYETEETFSQSSAVLASATRQMGNIRSRLDKLRISGGKRGADISNASLNIEGTSIPVGMFGGAAGDSNELLENSRWGLFANGEYAFGDKDQGKDLIVSTGGVTLTFIQKD